MQWIKGLLKHKCGEDEVVGEVPVGLAFEGFMVLVYAAAVCESDLGGIIKLYIVSGDSTLQQ